MTLRQTTWSLHFTQSSEDQRNKQLTTTFRGRELTGSRCSFLPIVAMQRDVKRTSLHMLVPQSLKFSWALIGRCKSESVRVFQRIFAENDAGFPDCLCWFKSARKQSRAFNTLSSERCKILCDLKEKNMLSRENVQFVCGFSGVGNFFLEWNADFGRSELFLQLSTEPSISVLTE